MCKRLPQGATGCANILPTRPADPENVHFSVHFPNVDRNGGLNKAFVRNRPEQRPLFVNTGLHLARLRSTSQIWIGAGPKRGRLRLAYPTVWLHGEPNYKPHGLMKRVYYSKNIITVQH